MNIKPDGDVRYLAILTVSVVIRSIGSPLPPKFEFILLPPLPILLTIYGSFPVSRKNSVISPSKNGTCPISFPTALIADVLVEPPNPNLPSSEFLIFKLSLLAFG